MTIATFHYADVRVTGDGVPQIVGTLVTRLHGFMTSKAVRLAVAFPKYKAGERPKIGDLVRFFGDADALNELLDNLDGDERERWMCGRVRETPECELMAYYLRTALPRRPDLSKPKHALNAEQMMNRRAQALHNMQMLPFFFVRSQSANVDFPFTVEKRFIKNKDIPLEVEHGDVNAYGFSTKTRTVLLPEF